jgi:hypothetical protein
VTIVDVLGVLRRRWFVALVGVAFTLVAVLAAGYVRDGNRLVSRYRPQYESTAVVHVRPASADPDAVARAGPLALALKATVESAPFLRQVTSEVPQAGGASVRASVPGQTSLVQLLVTGGSSVQATAFMEQLLRELPDALAALEPVAATAPPARVEVTGSPTPPASRPSAKGPLAIGLVALLGLALTWSLTVSLDRAWSTASVSRERSRSRAASGGVGRGESVVPTKAGARA